MIQEEEVTLPDNPNALSLLLSLEAGQLRQEKLLAELKASIGDLKGLESRVNVATWFGLFAMLEATLALVFALKGH